MAEEWRAVVAYCGLLVMLLGLLACVLGGEIKRQWREAKPFSRFVAVAAIVGATLYAGTKGTISFPYTDIELKYLIDAGSFVTNSAVRIAYTVAAGVPNSAGLFVDRRVVGSTNDADWVNFVTTTIRDFPSPQTLQVANATNWDWIVYTDWTPGSAVATNGVWHAYWGLDRKAHVKFVPARTCVRVDGVVIATPQSVWNAATNQTEEAGQ